MTPTPVPKVPTPKPRYRGLVLVLSFIFRLLLLSVGSGFAWVIGMAIAQVYPDTRSEMPFAESLFRQSQQALKPKVQPPSSSPVALPPSPTTPPAPLQPLTPAQRQKLRAQLQQLQGELNTLIGRTAAIETQVSVSRPTESLEKRLQILEQQLGTTVPNASSTPVTSSPTPTASQPALSSTPRSSSDPFVITLPSDILFDVGSTTLRPGANVILDNLIADIESYPGATIRVAGHTDNIGTPKQNLDLSFQRAETVMKYLSTAVGGSGYHWVAMGYGMGQPNVENNSDQNRQLNRRIEVAINP